MVNLKDKQLFPILYPENSLGVNNMGLVLSDPLGSYTGRPEDPLEEPVQDADDL